tara:strand:+ start:484 stop:672 length:189 start_codon:yes stop_codon:yes gene_type:complete
MDSQITYSLEDSSIADVKIKMKEINDNKLKDDTSDSKSNKDDIFGDEQTFPFVAGLGKNAAH